MITRISQTPSEPETGFTCKQAMLQLRGGYHCCKKVSVILTMLRPYDYQWVLRGARDIPFSLDQRPKATFGLGRGLPLCGGLQLVRGWPPWRLNVGAA